MTTVNARIARLASESVGLCACKPWREEFAKRLGPPPKGGWDLARPFIYRKCGVSTCMLFGCRWLWMEAGVWHEVNPPVPMGVRYDEHALRVDDPYVNGTVLARALNLAYKHGAVVQGRELEVRMPDPGDGIIITRSPGISNPTWDHWDTVVDWEGPGDDPLCVVVGAGQTCPHGKENGHQGAVLNGAHLQAILKKPPRKWIVRNHQVWIGSDRVIAFVRANFLPTVPVTN